MHMEQSQVAGFGKLVFSSKGGLRTGRFFSGYACSYPLAKIDIFENGIILTYPSESVNIYWKDLNSIVWKKFFFWGGIIISYKKNGEDKKIVFTSFNQSNIINIINKIYKGISVAK